MFHKSSFPTERSISHSESFDGMGALGSHCEIKSSKLGRYITGFSETLLAGIIPSLMC